MHFPANEKETIMLYRLIQNRLGWYIKHIQIAFPDVVIINQRGQTLIAEFEYIASNFHSHKHDPAGCDLIICWHNDWPDAPLPVWALESIAFEEARIVTDLITEPCSQNAELEGQVAILERGLRCATTENAILRERLGMVIYGIEG